MATDIKRERLAKAFERFVAFANIDDILQAALDEGAFSRAFHQRAFERAAKSAIRRLLKTGRLIQPDGTVIKVASMVIKTENGKEERVYKREDMFVQDDLFQVLAYWMAQKRRVEKKIKYYRDLGRIKFGAAFERQWPIFEQRDLNLR